jgi:hypothetical protein
MSDATSGKDLLTAETSGSPTTSAVPKGARQRLQAGGGVDRVANHGERHAVLAPDIAEDGRPIVDADAHREPIRRRALALVIPPFERLEHLFGAGERVCGIVGARRWNAEYGDDRIADVFVDGAATGKDLRGHPGVEFAQQRQDRFRRHGLSHLSEADDIGKQNADRLPADRAERLILSGQQVDDIRREVPGQVVAGPLGFLAQAIQFAQLGDIRQRLADRDLKVAQVHRFGDEIKRAPIHRSSQIGHVAISRDNDGPHGGLPLAQLA